jgi:hypothetical protein
MHQNCMLINPDPNHCLERLGSWSRCLQEFLPFLPSVLGLPRPEACEDQEVRKLVTAAFGCGLEMNGAKQLGWGVEGCEPDERIL